MMDTCLTSCICPEGGCTMSACISDCDNGIATEICDPGARCFEEGSTCAVGTETCCGKTHNSMECECMRNDEQFLEYACYFTDACWYPLCDRTDAPTPTPTVPDEATEAPIGSDAIIPPGATQAPVASEICDPGARCFEEGSTCAVGTETCCGKTHNSMECECMRNDEQFLEYACYFTDACWYPLCDRTDAPTPTPAVPEKGPPPSSSGVKRLAPWIVLGAFLGVL